MTRLPSKRITTLGLSAVGALLLAGCSVGQLRSQSFASVHPRVGTQEHRVSQPADIAAVRAQSEATDEEMVADEEAEVVAVDATSEEELLDAELASESEADAEAIDADMVNAEMVEADLAEEDAEEFAEEANEPTATAQTPARVSFGVKPAGGSNVEIAADDSYFDDYAMDDEEDTGFVAIDELADGEGDAKASDAPMDGDPTEGAIKMDDGSEEGADEGMDAEDETDSGFDDACCEEEESLFELGGWIQQGITLNASNPQDRFNGVVGTNDRADDYMMNQLWLYMYKEADASENRFDWGGEIAAVYGTDAQWFQMNDGLEESWDQTARFYQVALLRFYGDLAYENTTLRLGKFDSLVGYEAFEATESFFYSRSYSFLYGTPLSVLGAMVSQEINDFVSFNVGIHRGSGQFNDTDGLNSTDFLGGITLSNDEGDSWIDFQVMAEEKGEGVHQFLYSIVGHTMITDRTKYVLEHTFGENWGDDAEWYGIMQHLIYEIDDKWSAGARFEWFRDDDGNVVHGIRSGNVATGPFVGNFYAITAALNYEPCENLAIRPELRYDWYNPDNGGPQPFDSGDKDNQFLGSVDVIFAF